MLIRMIWYVGCALYTCFRAVWRRRRMPKINICCQLFIDTQNGRTKKKARFHPNLLLYLQYTLLPGDVSAQTNGKYQQGYPGKQYGVEFVWTWLSRLKLHRLCECDIEVHIKFSQHAKHNWFLTEIRLGRNICRVSWDAALKNYVGWVVILRLNLM